MARIGVPRDIGNEAEARLGGLWRRVHGLTSLVARQASTERRAWGLSAKLLLLTVLFVMLAEVLIFVPSIANFRVNWLIDRLTAAQLASLAAEAVPGGVVPDSLRLELLKTAKVQAVALKRNDQRRLVLPADIPPEIEATYDLRTSDRSGGLWDGLGLRVGLIWDAVAVFFAGDGRVIRVIGQPGMGAGDFIEIVLPQGPLKAAMLRYGLNVLGLSVIISVITAALVYFALNRLLVQPMMRITRNMLRFSENPEDASRIIAPSRRRDEIGTAERELAHMQNELTQLLHQKSRLAALGLAVSKINHDLRNMLASAQLISDRLGGLPDPSVQRFAPKLIASLDRAINLCKDTLNFGRAAEAPPRRDLMLLKPLVEEVGESLGLSSEGTTAWRVAIDPVLRIDADRDHIYRILTNLGRNAAQAIESQGSAAQGQIKITARREGRRVIIDVSDDGPGVPQRARAHLFQAFQGSTRRGGTGLGLAIAHELAVAHGGTIVLTEAERGASFRLEIPDRAVLA
jgi:signal transduction histidine kinase